MKSSMPGRTLSWTTRHWKSGGHKRFSPDAQASRLPTANWASSMRRPQAFWVAAERLSMLRAVYPVSQVEPLIVPPESESRRSWERSEAIRELIRGRMEVAGPVAARALAELFQLPRAEIDAALLALEAEGFVLRGRFHPDAPELQWCDRRLLARIHRLTI